MACLICKQSASYFSSYSCKNLHKVHKDCLLSGKFDIDLFKNCKSCIGKILCETKPSSYCFECGSSLPSPPANCKKFRNFCKTCTAQYLERHHFQSCKPCKESYQNIVKECFSCRTLSLKKEIFYTPRCNLHPFCKNCINQVPSDLKLCSDCVVYFTILQQRDDPSRMICNLCGKFPDGNTATCMQGHYYCKHCIMLTKQMDIRIYYRVRKCPSCLKMLQMIEIDSDGGILIVNHEENNFEEEKF